MPVAKKKGCNPQGLHHVYFQRMINLRKAITVGFAAMAMFLGNADLQAQGRSGQGGKGDKGGPAGRGGQERGRGWDFGDMRARMMERMQEQFGFSDAEFKAIRPLIEDVQTKQREVLGGRMSSMFRSFTGRSSSRGGRDESNSEQSALERALKANSSIESKLAAYRKVRDEKRAALKKSQDTLKSVLTLKQEAQAVLMGLID
jgi:hypothetical protein